MAENDIQSALTKLLADPEALSGIMSMASGLMGSMGTPSEANFDQHRDSPASDDETVSDTNNSETSISDKAPPEGGLPDLSAIMGLLGAQKKNDPRCSLLYALRPFMSRERAERIDSLVNALRLADLAGGVIKKGGLF